MNTLELLHRLTAQLHRRGHTVTCAESCSGGLLAAELTRLPGSSAWFESSFVTYSNRAKQTLLNVQAASLHQYGAVSEVVVREMATGAQAVTHADYALAISGIAGPSGGSTDKPVGTVWFALVHPHGIDSECCHFTGERDVVRAQSVLHALAMLAACLQKDGENGLQPDTESL
ncbi:MAG: CinA family protein [Neisseria sp.]|nr:CinA family protein [Neisseria sp.]